ncbi:MAG: cobaltochelatase subunit CobT, partial [Alphaproteobacteria bacterium]
MAEAESPTEVFKRNTAAVMRAMAKRQELDVTFGPDAASTDGKSAQDGDLALRLRHHDETAHAGRRPTGGAARAAFDALEQARCEAIGALQMQGVSANLEDALVERCRRQGYSRVVEREDAPL